MRNIPLKAISQNSQNSQQIQQKECIALKNKGYFIKWTIFKGKNIHMAKSRTLKGENRRKNYPLDKEKRMVYIIKFLKKKTLNLIKK